MICLLREVEKHADGRPILVNCGYEMSFSLRVSVKRFFVSRFYYFLSLAFVSRVSFPLVLRGVSCPLAPLHGSSFVCVRGRGQDGVLTEACSTVCMLAFFVGILQCSWDLYGGR